MLAVEQAGGSGPIWLEGVLGAGIQALVLAIGGVWAFLLYRRRREFQATIRIEASIRVTQDAAGGYRIFLKLHLANESAAFITIQSIATLMAVDPKEEGQMPGLIVLSKQDALACVYGEPEADVDEADNGGEVGEMEPGECVETELLFARPRQPDLLAVRVTVEGFRPPWAPRVWVATALRWIARRPGREPKVAAEWDLFAYIDAPALVGAGVVELSTPHAPQVATEPS